MDREQLRQELLEELKQEYKLIPIKEARFEVKDILEKYYDDICIKLNIHRDYSSEQMIGNAIRKAVNMHFGYIAIKDVPSSERNNYRIELEKFIKEYILGGKN